MLKVFLSYARADNIKGAARLRDELKFAFDVWRDIEDMQSGESWREQLSDALHEVDVVIVLLTPAAVASSHVTEEWKGARLLKKPVIPVLISPCTIPEELREIHYQNLSDPDNYGQGLMALRNDLTKAYDSIYQKLKDDLSNHLKKDALALFHPILKKLLHWSNLKFYPPRILNAFTELVDWMNADYRQGHSLADIFDQAITGNYAKPGSDLHTVFEANRNIFETVLGLFRAEVKLGEIIPIVLLIMNETEAQELASGAAFDGYPNRLRSEFKKLQSMLKKNGLANWVSNYKETSADWQPFGSEADGENIQQLVGKALKMIASPSHTLIPSFKDIHRLNDISSRQLLRQLRYDGCIVIIDGISMRHPKLLRAFHQTALDSSHRTSIVTIAPAQSTFQLLREMSFVLQLKVSDLELAKRRYDYNEEYGICVELSDANDLQRWILDRVRKMYLPQAAAQTSIKDFMFENFGRP
ncbi:MAG: toll/interleukin-1 receptor domain-containing protein [Acidobacteria bacterium]|nr:toll/interleukin-1 receptor domain-containing protein [Acidobacteriota bacterium]